jgi:hypothetical protein
MSVNLQHLQWGIPVGAFPCWVISESDRNRSLKESKPYKDGFTRPPCYFQSTKRLDNNFIHGHLAHIEESKFHDRILSRYTYFADYEKRTPVYFSFDGVTLYKLIEILPTYPLTFAIQRIDNPKAIIPNRAFMIMPFKDPRLNTLYKDHLAPFLLSDKDLKVQIFRADDFNGNDIIVETIYHQIEQSEFIIADISHPNKNVFYELGWASAMEKEIIMIQSQDIEQNVFFDRSHIRTRLYSIKNIPELQRQLKNDIIAIRQKMSSRN